VPVRVDLSDDGEGQRVDLAGKRAQLLQQRGGLVVGELVDAFVQGEGEGGVGVVDRRFHPTHTSRTHVRILPHAVDYGRRNPLLCKGFRCPQPVDNCMIDEGLRWTAGRVADGELRRTMSGRLVQSRLELS
jgi:hypothetical protein